jgi:hypothetical protein
MAHEEEALRVPREHHLVPLAAPSAEQLLQPKQYSMTSGRGHLLRQRGAESLVRHCVHAPGERIVRAVVTACMAVQP